MPPKGGALSPGLTDLGSVSLSSSPHFHPFTSEAVSRIASIKKSFIFYNIEF